MRISGRGGHSCPLREWWLLTSPPGSDSGLLWPSFWLPQGPQMSMFFDSFSMKWAVWPGVWATSPFGKKLAICTHICSPAQRKARTSEGRDLRGRMAFPCWWLRCFGSKGTRKGLSLGESTFWYHQAMWISPPVVPWLRSCTFVTGLWWDPPPCKGNIWLRNSHHQGPTLGTPGSQIH